MNKKKDLKTYILSKVLDEFSNITRTFVLIIAMQLILMDKVSFGVLIIFLYFIITLIADYEGE